MKQIRHKNTVRSEYEFRLNARIVFEQDMNSD